MSDRNQSTVTTDAELQAQFNERNENLKNTVNNVVDKIDEAASKTQNYFKNQQENSMVTDPTGIIGGIGQTTNTELNQSSQEPDMTGSLPDRVLMESIKGEVKAMHSTDPEISKEISSKFEETFGHNALA